MSEFQQVLEAAKKQSNPQGLVAAIPYGVFLGLRADEMPEGGLKITMPRQDKLTGNPTIPALHGGTTGSLLETAALLRYAWEFERMAKIVNLTIHYMRSGKIADTYAFATFLKRGRRVMLFSAEAWQSHREKPIAMATGHLLV